MKPDEEYLELDAKIRDIEMQKNTDSHLISIKNRVASLIEEQSRIEEVYNQRLLPLLDRREELLAEFKNLYDGTKKKQLGLLILSYRITRSLKILDPGRVVEILEKNKKVKEGIKSFNLMFIRKLADAGVIPEDVARFENNVNVKVEKNDKAKEK